MKEIRSECQSQVAELRRLLQLRADKVSQLEKKVREAHADAARRNVAR
jgi:hypothetical protein